MIRAGLVLLLAVGACSSATPAAGPPDLADHRGRFVVSCAPSHTGFDDPLLLPGRAGASHLHEFFGNVAIDEGDRDRRVAAASVAGADTTCETAADRASYWVPALLDEDGARIAPDAIDAYYRAGRGVEPTDVVAYPSGLGVVAGGGPDRDPPPTSVVGWSCSANPRRSAAPPDCEGELRLRVTFPDCWDGSDLHGDDHRGHMAYSGVEGCPAAHPVAVPQLELVVRYPASGGEELSLSSGPIDTAHADFWNLWEPAALEREVRACLHGDVVCGNAAG
ncbi:MAG: DUF1996 domain-containing protein [Acidimicrobiales bacterium]|nr:DUF1996 domain-containing protein [Acidimicrobiales bacterium]